MRIENVFLRNALLPEWNILFYDAFLLGRFTSYLSIKPVEDKNIFMLQLPIFVEAQLAFYLLLDIWEYVFDLFSDLND